MKLSERIRLCQRLRDESPDRRDRERYWVELRGLLYAAGQGAPLTDFESPAMLEAYRQAVADGLAELAIERLALVPA